MLSHSNAEICVHLGYTKDKIIKPTDGSNATGVAPLFFLRFFLLLLQQQDSSGHRRGST